MLASNPDIVPRAYSLFLHAQFFKVAYPQKRVRETMTMGMPLGKEWGWRKRKYASGTTSGLLASTQNETSFTKEIPLISFVMTKTHL